MHMTFDAWLDAQGIQNMRGNDRQIALARGAFSAGVAVGKSMAAAVASQMGEGEAADPAAIAAAQEELAEVSAELNKLNEKNAALQADLEAAQKENEELREQVVELTPSEDETPDEEAEPPAQVVGGEEVAE